VNSTQPRQHYAEDAQLLEIQKLIRSSFAYMDGRIDPPSSMHRLTVADIAQSCRSGEVWSMGEPICACMMLKLKPNVLYLGKLAIKENCQRQGIGKSMIEHAVQRAKHHKKAFLEIRVRLELIENHAYFKSQGFRTVAKKAHPGFLHSTYKIMHRPACL